MTLQKCSHPNPLDPVNIFSYMTMEFWDMIKDIDFEIGMIILSYLRESSLITWVIKTFPR